MAKYLAVDWDSVEVRFVLGNLQRDRVTVLQAGSAPVEIEEDPSGQVIRHYAPTLKSLLRKHKISRTRLLLGLGRSSLELLNLEIPPAGKDDIPDLVVNQVLHDSPNYSEGQPLDFHLLSHQAGQLQKVLAVTLTRTQLKQFRTICHDAGQKASKIEFTPFALADLFRQSNLADHRPVLLFQASDDEAEMVILNEKEILSTRSVRFPTVLSSEERLSRISTEITRTLAVAAQDLPDGGGLNRVIIFGDPDELAPIADHFTEGDVNIEIRNPFQINCVSGKAVAKSPGSYAALLGMILAESPGCKPAIDFLHPHEKPQPINIARYAVLLVFLLGVFGTVAYFWNRKELKKFDAQLATLQEEIKQQQTLFQQYYPMQARLSAVASWENTQLIWLDELRDLCLRLPSEHDLVITGMQFAVSPNRSYVGYIDLQGRARDWSVIQAIQRLFYDQYHVTQLRNHNRTSTGGGYPWSFSFRIYCAKRPPQQFLVNLSEDLREQSKIMPDPTRNRNVRQPQTPVTPTTQNPQPSTVSVETGTMQTVFPSVYVPKTREIPDQVFPPGYVPQDVSTEQVEPPTYTPAELPEQVQPPVYVPN